MPYKGRLENTPLLELIQILAYSRKSGLLTVKSGDVRGLVIFQEGNVVCSYSPGALSLLVKAAKEADPNHRFSLRRIQVLTSLRELFDLPEGDYRFVRASEPVPELEGLDIGVFYADGALDSGDLLVALEKAMYEEAEIAKAAPPPREDYAHKRQHQRFGPIIIKGVLVHQGKAFKGFLTNLSLGGTFFHADELPPLESVCDLHFMLPEEIGRCQARAKVVWLRSEGSNTKRGAGLAFDALTAETERKVSSYLNWFQELATDIDFQA